MKVSIVIPVFNTPKEYLKKCLESIRDQTESDYEVIIVDDGSSEKTADFLDAFSKSDARFHVFHCSNHGVSAARNYGMMKAHGEFLTFIDADDFIEQNMLERMLGLAEQYCADIVMCHHDRIVCGQREEVDFVGQSLCVCHRADIPMLQSMVLNVYAVEDKYVWHTFICTCGKLYKRSRLQEVSFPTDVKDGEDAFFCFQALENMNTMIIVDEPLYHYVQWDGSAGHRFHPEIVESWKLNRRTWYQILSNGNYDAAIWNAYDMHALGSIKRLLFSVFAHPDNKEKKMSVELKKTVSDDCFARSIDKLQISEQRNTKSKLVLFLLQHRQYELLIWLTRFRLKQLKGVKEK